MILRTWSDKFRRRPSDSPIVTNRKTSNLGTPDRSSNLGMPPRPASHPEEPMSAAQTKVASSETTDEPPLRVTEPMRKVPQPSAIKTPLQELQEEIARPNVDGNRRLKMLLKSSLFRGHIPPELRFKVWQRLLGVKDDPEGDAQLTELIQACPRDLPNQRVIRVDVERTRVDLTEFREPQTQEFLMQLLTFFCKDRACRYKQGLNELLAPFVYLLTQRENFVTRELSCEGAEAIVYRMWTAFVDRFAPHLYDLDAESDGEEMVALQCAFRYFDILVLYHDPELWSLLDYNRLKPELYASPWLMTLLAQNIPMAQAFQLWEAMLLGEGHSGDSLIVTFVAVAFLCSNRSAFLEADPSDLPVLLTSKLSYHRRGSNQNVGDGSNSLVLLTESLRLALNTANELRKHTSDMLLFEMRRTLYDKQIPPTTKLLKRLDDRLCATCSPQFFWLGITKKLEDSTEIVVIDCRSRREFERKRARGRLVFNFGREVLESPETLRGAIGDLKRHVLSTSDTVSAGSVPDSLARAWRWHICVIGDVCQSVISDYADQTPLSSLSGEASLGSDNDDMDNTTRMCVQHLLKHLLPCVSVVEGGWESVLAACPDPDELLFPLSAPYYVSDRLAPRPSSTQPSPEKGPVLASTGVKHSAYRRPHASYADIIDDIEGPSFIVSRSSRGAPVMKF